MKALIQSEKEKLENLKKQRQTELERLQVLQADSPISTFFEGKMAESKVPRPR
jgi:hypothetical protein